MNLQRSIFGIDRIADCLQSSPMTKRRPPANWLHLHSGDMVNSTMPKHRIDNYIKELELYGYLISTEPTSRGYRLNCLKSPLDQPKPTKLRLVKG